MVMAERLKMYRMARGLNQKELADELNKLYTIQWKDKNISSNCFLLGK